MRDRLRRPGEALARAARTLQFRALAVLFVLLGFQAVIALPAALGMRDTLAAMARAELSDRLQLDISQLVVGMQHQQIGITGYVETADPTYRDDFLFGQSLVAT